ncbi:MAG: substrate-binding domain-containing protein [Opitutales bacterium]|nr:substrate-binding domain-containing protein [Opitutales bacterium]
MMRGLAAYARDCPEHWIIDFNSFGQPCTECLQQVPYDGVVLHGATDDEAKALESYGIPRVYVSARSPTCLNLETVTVDNQAIGRKAAELLSSLGTRRFVFVSRGPFYFDEERYAGFQSGLCHEEAIAVEWWRLVAPEGMERVRPVEGNGKRPLVSTLSDWCANLPARTAIFASEDDTAVPLCSAARETGRLIPEDLILLGCNNDLTLCELARPHLSSIDLDPFQWGREVMQTLRSLVRNEAVHFPRLVPPGGIVERQSTAAHPEGYPLVMKACEVVRSRFRDPDLKVTDLARELKVSRRLMEMRFRQILGHGPGEEIRRRRLEHAKELLENTDLPVGALAHFSGFNSQQNFNIAFRRSEGLSPQQFRKR